MALSTALVFRLAARVLLRVTNFVVRNFLRDDPIIIRLSWRRFIS